MSLLVKKYGYISQCTNWK